jgi:hypothetical protein
VSVLKYSLSICLEELRKIMKNLSQDRRSLSQDSNTGHPRYESEVLLHCDFPICRFGVSICTCGNSLKYNLIYIKKID